MTDEWTKWMDCKTSEERFILMFQAELDQIEIKDEKVCRLIYVRGKLVGSVDFETEVRLKLHPRPRPHYPSPDEAKPCSYPCTSTNGSIKKMPTFLRPHTGVKCPKMPKKLIEQGYYLGVGACEKCPYKIEIRRPWRGFIVKCELEGKSDSVTVEYGGGNTPDWV